MQDQKIFTSSIEALKHLIENYPGNLPTDLNTAKYRISDGVRYTKTSKKVYPLKEAGAKSMLKKYGGGHYVVSEVVTYTSTDANAPTFVELAAQFREKHPNAFGLEEEAI